MARDLTPLIADLSRHERADMARATLDDMCDAVGLLMSITYGTDGEAILRALASDDRATLERLPCYQPALLARLTDAAGRVAFGGRMLYALAETHDADLMVQTIA